MPDQPRLRREESLVEVPAGPVKLQGIIGVPDGAKGIVLFAHGSGSSRLSPRNNHVARILRSGGLATLLTDLLTVEEASDRANVFDIDFLARRLMIATDWLAENDSTEHLAVGYFGSSTGAGAALAAAARAEGGPGALGIGRRAPGAVVSRGGRPDLAGDLLESVKAPTLLIVGGNDAPVIQLNREAYVRLRTDKDLVIIPDATHLFEEPGALEEVARLASEWFTRYLGGV